MVEIDYQQTVKEDDCMKAVQVNGYGDVDQLEVVERPMPAPKKRRSLN